MLCDIREADGPQSVGIRAVAPKKDTQARQRFEREARTGSSLNHPNICSLYDIGRRDGLYYLVLGHLDGQTLAASLGTGPLPLEEALRYAAQIADALHQAHGQGVVHRDVKPGNVILINSGSSDGDYLAMMVGGEETGADIWIAPASGEGEAYPFLQSKSLEGNPSFSPDGRWLAYASTETGAFEVYVSSFEQPSRRWQVSTGGGQSPRWRGDGGEIFYSTPGDRLVATRIDLDGSVPYVGATEPLFELKVPSESIRQLYEVSPDGQRFLVPEPTSAAQPGETALVLVSDWTACTAASAER